MTSVNSYALWKTHAQVLTELPVVLTMEDAISKLQNYKEMEMIVVILTAIPKIKKGLSAMKVGAPHKEVMISHAKS